MISVFALHRTKSECGPNADTFYPDHFLPENSEKRHVYSYIPFGGGLRTCIGSRYSLLTMKTSIIYILLNYKLNTELTMKDLRPKIDVTLKLANSHLVSVQRR